MADAEIIANLDAAITKSSSGGVRSYSQGDLSVVLEPIKDLLDARDRLAARVDQSPTARATIPEVLDP